MSSSHAKPTQGKSLPRTWTCDLHVRGYELDSFGHVNHAVYISYLEHARWELLAHEGITLEKFRNWKRWPVIAALEARYHRPAFLGDLLRVSSRVSEGGRTRFTFEQIIHRGTEKIFSATVHAVMVDEKGRPASTPDEIAEIWAAHLEAASNKTEGEP